MAISVILLLILSASNFIGVAGQALKTVNGSLVMSVPGASLTLAVDTTCSTTACADTATQSQVNQVVIIGCVYMCVRLFETFKIVRIPFLIILNFGYPLCWI